jgi:putative transposase
VLNSYVRHYNTGRPHRGLHLAIPTPPSSQDDNADADADAAIERTDILGGLIHEYRRAA